jgi:transposase-like protein
VNVTIAFDPNDVAEVERALAFVCDLSRRAHVGPRTVRRAAHELDVEKPPGARETPSQARADDRAPGAPAESSRDPYEVVVQRRPMTREEFDALRESRVGKALTTPWPPQAKAYAVELACRIGTQRAAKETGIAQSGIWRWCRDAGAAVGTPPRPAAEPEMDTVAERCSHCHKPLFLKASGSPGDSELIEVALRVHHDNSPECGAS